MMLPGFLKKLKIRKLLTNPRFQLWLVLLLLLLLRFNQLILGKTLIFGDNYSLMVPGKLFTAHWLSQGLLPLWNPTILTGISWIGDINQSVLYPSSLLFVLFKAWPGLALNSTLIIHLVLAYFGMYWASKKVLRSHFPALAAAVLWTASTQLTGALNNISSLQSLTWLPLVVGLGLNISRSMSDKLLFAGVVLLQLLGGYPTFALYAVLTAVIFSFTDTLRIIDKRSYHQPFLNWIIFDWLKNWLITGLLTVGLSAFVWLPFLQTLSQSTRTIQTQTQAQAGSLHPFELVKLVIPYFFDYARQGIKWGPNWNQMPNLSLYFTWIGLIALLAAVKAVVTSTMTLVAGFGRDDSKIIVSFNQKLIWVLILMITTIFSFGKYLPFDITVVTGPVRGPSLALVVANFVGSLLIADQLFKLKTKSGWLWQAGCVFIVGVVSWLIVQLNFPQIWSLADTLLGNRLAASSFHTMAKDYLIGSNILQYGVINAGLLLLVFLALKHRRQLLVVLVMTVDLLINTQGLLFFAPSATYLSQPDQFVFADKLTQDQQARTLIRNFNQPYTDFGAYWEALAIRHPFSDSYVDLAELKNYQHLQRLAAGMTPDWNMVSGANAVTGYTTLLPIAVDQVWSKAEQPAINNLPPIGLNHPQLSNWAVKYYLVDNWFSVEEDLSSFQLIDRAGSWSLYQLPALPRFRFADGEKAQAAPPDLNIEENPNRIVLSFTNDTGANHLFVADRFESNWRAQVNQQPVDIQNYHEMRLIPVQPGQNQVEIYYFPRYFYLGLAISGSLLIICLTVMTVQVFYQRQS